MLYLNLCQVTLWVFVMGALSIDENNAINLLELSKRLYILCIFIISRYLKFEEGRFSFPNSSTFVVDLAA